MAKTMVFCTSYFEDREHYYLRYKKWISYYLHTPFSVGKDFFMFDDGSNLSVADNLYNYIDGPIRRDSKIEKMNFVHFAERWGNLKTANHPGWYRSFLSSVGIAEALGYEKVIHVESDLYLLSNKICDYIDNANSGWISFLCPKYNFAESSLQIINKDSFSKFKNFKNEILAKGLTSMAQTNVEHILPISHLERGFVGDRYGEAAVPQKMDMDFYAQARLEDNFKFVNKE